MPRGGPHLETRRALVARYMTHRHSRRCGGNDANCRYNFPFDVIPETYMREDGRITYRRREEEDAWIVGHNVALLEEFQCHINVEVISSVESFGYLFKYFWKGITLHV